MIHVAGIEEDECRKDDGLNEDNKGEGEGIETRERRG